jgi:hypothetical protein
VKARKDEEFIELSDISPRRILAYATMLVVMIIVIIRHVDPLPGNDRETNK